MNDQEKESGDIYLGPRACRALWSKGYHRTLLEFLLFFFYCAHMACGILVSEAGIEPAPPAVIVQSLPQDRQGSPELLWNS